MNILKTLLSESRSVTSGSLQSQQLYSPWNSPGHNTGVGSLSLLQRIFPIQGSNPGLLQVDSLPAEPQRKLKEQVSFNFMGVVTICSDFGATPKIKSVTVSVVSPSICHEVMEPDAMILVF